MKRAMTLLSLLLVPGIVAAEELAAADKPAGKQELVARSDEAAKAAPAGPKVISGMSILGNQEAPKSLVIVPWKSSEIGDAVGIATLLDDSRRPVDRDVFARELAYYQIKAGK
jgi:hypothetical protein